MSKKKVCDVCKGQGSKVVKKWFREKLVICGWCGGTGKVDITAKEAVEKFKW